MRHVSDVVGELDDLTERQPRCRQAPPQVVKHLAGLRGRVAGADELAVFADGDLARHGNQPPGAGDDVAVAGARGDVFGLDVGQPLLRCHSRILTRDCHRSCWEDAGVTGVYLEIGQRRVFACARDWPGWARAGRGEDAALVALKDAGPRFAVVCARAGVPFDGPAAVASFEVVERVAGSATTDFGALDACAGVDREPLIGEDADRVAALVGAAWDAFGQAAGAAPPVLRK